MVSQRRPALLVLDHASGWVRADGETVLGFDLAPGVAAGLARLKESGFRISAIALGKYGAQARKLLAQYLPFVDAVVIRPPEAPSIVIAADRVVRARLAGATGRGYPHAAIAAAAVGGPVVFARCVGRREAFEKLPGLVPYFAEYAESRREWMMLAAMPKSATGSLIERGVEIQVLPLDFTSEDPLWVQLDGADKTTSEALRGEKVLLRDGSRTLIAIGPDRFNDSLGIHGPHGHFQSLMPQPDLADPAPPVGHAFKSAQVLLGRLPLERLKISRTVLDILDVIFRKCPASAASFQADVDRYSGVVDLDASGPVVSRHIRNTDNARVVQALLADLRAIGYCAYTHTFTLAGLTLENVIADLPGTGYFRIDPDILREIREVLVKFPLPNPPDPWRKPIERIIGKDQVQQENFAIRPQLDARLRLERLLEFRHCWPWWLRLCPLAGCGAEIVIAGCHLDSTAARTVGYDPVTGPAPGADDDGSGIAAMLALARHFWGYRGKLPHTVRFCFFNAEEQGLVGSKAYAAMLKAANAPVRAVICADMIGFNSDSERLFEVHAGYTDAAVRDASVPIADIVAAWAASLGQLPPAQVYKGTSNIGGPDRNSYDGAINRSDHAAFHQNGYPAVVVSEDFFVNLSTEPGANPNPNYHESGDNLIDPAYAADITCAIGWAVKELAGG